MQPGSAPTIGLLVSCLDTLTTTSLLCGQALLHLLLDVVDSIHRGDGPAAVPTTVTPTPVLPTLLVAMENVTCTSSCDERH
jgi:hypothetical protein